ncbi:MAG: diaminopimelate epimerase [Burkholderiales bacterium]|jgi:diaminopimelate epimerase|nr:diaminopimelate epimerase [Burkholderiales bacterium]
MRLRFTKMQGAGNDFVVLDAIGQDLALTPAQMRHLGDRRFGVGADQILVVEAARTPGMDFRYRIFNGASGEEVEHCGNGARCFVRFVRDQGLTDRDTIRVETVNNQLELRLQPDGRVTVDMNQPQFAPASLPFDATGLQPRWLNGVELWALDLATAPAPTTVEVTTVSMGNPHAVLRVDDVDRAPVATWGPLIEGHRRFPRRVNAGFLQVLSRQEVRLRVYERDAGETLACGTGACAAVVAGIRLGWLDPTVEVQTRGGRLTITWNGPGQNVWMTGPAERVFEGEIDLTEASSHQGPAV